MVMTAVIPDAQLRIVGALLREPGIHNPRREYGFRACAKRAHPGMTKVKREVLP
jgi:hypothetical protein